MLTVDDEAALDNHGEAPLVEGGEGLVLHVCWGLLFAHKRLQNCLASPG